MQIEWRAWRHKPYSFEPAAVTDAAAFVAWGFNRMNRVAAAWTREVGKVNCDLFSQRRVVAAHAKPVLSMLL